MRLIIIEGTDGTGTTTHAQSLAGLLLNRQYPAISYHHPRHNKGDSDWTRALHYAHARAKLVDMSHDDNLVVVADRWAWSNQVCAYLSKSATVTAAIINLWVMEDQVLPRPVLTILLDAPDEVLSARLAVKTLDPLECGATRQHYLNVVGPYAHIINTNRPFPAVAEDILALALRALGDPRA
jgi:thymidylate kinase